MLESAVSSLLSSVYHGLESLMEKESGEEFYSEINKMLDQLDEHFVSSTPPPLKILGLSKKTYSVVLNIFKGLTIGAWTANLIKDALEESDNSSQYRNQATIAFSLAALSMTGATGILWQLFVRRKNKWDEKEKELTNQQRFDFQLKLFLLSLKKLNAFKDKKEELSEQELEETLKQALDLLHTCGALNSGKWVWKIGSLLPKKHPARIALETLERISRPFLNMDSEERRKSAILNSPTALEEGRGEQLASHGSFPGMGETMYQEDLEEDHSELFKKSWESLKGLTIHEITTPEAKITKEGIWGLIKV